MPLRQPSRRRSELTFFSDTGWIGLGILAIAALLLEHGFFLSAPWLHTIGWIDMVLAGTILVDYLGGLALAKKKIFYLRRRIVEGALALLLTTILSYTLYQYAKHSESLNFIHYLQNEMSLLLVVVQCYLALNVGLYLLNALRRFFSLNIPAPLLIASSYLMVITAGASLLMLPKTAAIGTASLSLQEAIFTSTSAVTVTGLSIIDVGTHLSLFGQTVLLSLIQIGGISLVSIVGMLAYTEGERMNLRQMKVLRTALGLHDLKDMRQMLSVVILFTFTMEAIGALTLFATVPEVGGSWSAHLYWSIFHSISAFCNAGFSLQTDSLMQWATHPGLNIILPILIISGGLGFPVAFELLKRARHYDLGEKFLQKKNRLIKKPFQPHLRLQTRYALIGSAILLFVVFITLWGLGGDTGGTFWVSFFQSASLRTAGFNTVDLEQFSMAVLVVLMIAMFIGASPFSTGGGIKTVTMAVLLQTFRSFLTGRTVVVTHNRTIPNRTVWAAMTVFFFYLAMLCLTFFALCLIAPEVPLRDLLFESVSAIGTVGASLGATSKVGVFGQWFLMLAMIVGKIGPLTLAIGVLAGRERTSLIKYPQEEVIVG